MPSPKETLATHKSNAPQTQDAGRKAWRKKTPVEVFLDQEAKLRNEVTEMEDELKQKRKQLEKFEQARKLFEAS